MAAWNVLVLFIDTILLRLWVTFHFLLEDNNGANDSQDAQILGISSNHEENQNIVTVAKNGVVEAAFGQGGSLVVQWFPGHSASHVVCEDSSVQKYLGHSSYLVTTLKETRPQRLVHLSGDLARQIGMMLDNVQHGATD
nr:hypothetical protein [Tanacetum cinerariifolium]